jgi:hypothetical protein
MADAGNDLLRELVDQSVAGASPDALSALLAEVERLQRVEEAARAYRLVALERPGEEEDTYLPWLLRANAAGNVLDEALHGPSAEDPE